MYIYTSLTSGPGLQTTNCSIPTLIKEDVLRCSLSRYAFISVLILHVCKFICIYVHASKYR